MIRLIVFLILVTALGFAFAWVADRPGEISLVWQGMRYQTSLMVAVAAFVALVVAIMLAWWAVMTVLRSPTIMRRFLRDRRRDRGYSALSRGLIAAGSGDPHNARRLAQDSRKLLGSEPLVELLDAQTLLLEGEHGKARERFEAMREDDGTKLVALRGLYLEAEREGAREAARHYAKEAVEAAPSLAWAGNARLRHLSADGDWPGALAALETMRAAGTLDKAEAARKRAVLLTAEAMSELRAEPEKAARLAREAHRLAVDLVPAAVTAATALVRSGELRKAAGILEATWKKAPHPDIADAYVHLRSGDSVRDRLKRARKLAGMQPDHVESRFAVAEAAVAATEWKA
ncbi:MAG: heme biosynthesis HemY N-terminal domain-containing protein, partial [Pseudomonadota bacterium]|nr:heme biosynthesis HemY N-terminal domain-containing protein [Pseudomonadota bacterium]